MSRPLLCVVAQAAQKHAEAIVRRLGTELRQPVWQGEAAGRWVAKELLAMGPGAPATGHGRWPMGSTSLKRHWECTKPAAQRSLEWCREPGKPMSLECIAAPLHVLGSEVVLQPAPE